MLNVMVVRKVGAVMSSEWLVDTDGFAVEFASQSQAQKQINLMKQSDTSIIDFVVE